QFGPGVAAIVHKRKVLGAVDRSRCQGEWRDINGVPRRLVIEAEAFDDGRIHGEADLGQTWIERNPFNGRGDAVRRRLRERLSVCGMEGIREQSVLDVCSNQLLMLL